MSVARLSPQLKAKLAPLLRLQSSSNDYERANASAAISLTESECRGLCREESYI